MGQKTNPTGFRLAIRRNWQSRWFARKKDFPKLLLEDQIIRNTLMEKLKQASVPRIFIERAGNRVRVKIFTARPGIVIGKKGSGIDQVRLEAQKLSKSEIFVNVLEVRKAEADAQLISENIADQLEKRVAFRRAMKKAMSQAFKFGVSGIKIQCSGRLGGAEIARVERYAEGSVPLHTLRADIDYGTAEALTTYGLIGIKVWVYKGEVIGKQLRSEMPEAVPATPVVKADVQPVVKAEGQKV